MPGLTIIDNPSHFEEPTPLPLPWPLPLGTSTQYSMNILYCILGLAAVIVTGGKLLSLAVHQVVGGVMADSHIKLRPDECELVVPS